MRRLSLLALLLAGVHAPGARADESAAAARGDVVSLRFAWPADARARVSFRRTRQRTGERTEVFTARYETVAERGPAGFRVSTRGTSWKGDLPVPPALAPEAMRASEAVVQRILPQGQFLALDGVEAMRPVLARVLDDAKVPPDQAERALALALAATRAEAEELWNLAVGFWTGADLRVGERYAMQSEAELPLLPGVRAPQAVEFRVSGRVPCAASERAPRCVEVVLRSTPDRAALEAAAPALLARLLPNDAERRGSRVRLPLSETVRESSGARAPSERVAPRPDVDLSAERTLVLVTDPGTLLPRRMAWSRTVRLGGGEGERPAAEQVDRSEWDWRWAPPPAPPKPKKRTPAPAALEKPSPPA